MDEAERRVDRCGACGVVGPVVPGWSGGVLGTTRRCPACTRDHLDAQTSTTLQLLVVMVALAGVLLALGGDEIGVSRGAVVWPAVAVVVAAAHELGHAVVARLVGFRLHRIVVGAGPRLAATTVGGTDLELRALPAAGLTIASSDSPDGFRARHTAVVTAGPAASAALLALCLAWHPAGPWVAAARDAGVWVGVVVLLSALAPVEVGGQRSDGRLLLDALRMGPDEVAASLAQEEDVAFQLAERDGDVAAMRAQVADERAAGRDDLAALARRSVVAMRDHDYDEALDLLRRIEPAWDPPDAVLWNNLAWAAVMTFDPDVLAWADRWSEGALAATPWEPAAQGTRGAVLVQLGRIDEGRALLERSDARPGLSDADRSMNRAWRALAHLRGGDVLGARALLVAAAHADGDNPLVERVAAQLPTSPPPPPPGAR